MKDGGGDSNAVYPQGCRQAAAGIFCEYAEQRADLQIQKIHEENRAFLPLNLALTNEGVERWLKHRTIPKNRAYVDALLSKTGLSINRPLGIIAVCKGLSLNDCYWVDQADDQTTFEKVNLYENRFSQVWPPSRLLGMAAACAPRC